MKPSDSIPFLRTSVLIAALAGSMVPPARAIPLGPPATVVDGVAPEAWIQAADMDNDGDGDLLYSPGPGKLDLLRRADDGTFSALPLISSGVTRVLGAVAVDVDRDGKMDVAAYVQFSAQSTGIRVIRQGIWNIFLTTSPVDLTAGALPAEQAPLQSADLDRDGLPDLVMTWKTSASGTDKGRFSWFRNTGGGTFSTAITPFLQVFDAPCDLAVTDANRDGFPDLLVADNSKNELVLFKGPSFSAREVTGLSDSPRHLKVLDRNTDGWPDVMAAFGLLGSGGVQGLRIINGSAGGFSPGTLFSSLALTVQSSLAMADLNLDGTQDFVIANKKTGNFQAQGMLDKSGALADSFPSPFMANPTGGVTAQDDDGDGDADLFFTTTTSVLRMENKMPHRAVSSTVQSLYSATGLAPDTSACFAVADFNRDGRPDVVSVSASDGKIRLYLNGAGSTISSVTVATNPGCRWVAAGDFDRDGDMDIAAPSPALNRVVWYENNGSGGGWTTNIIPLAVAVPTGIAVGDINLDGLPDIVTASANTSAVHLLTNGADAQTWTSTAIGSLPGVIRLEIADVVPGQRPEVLAQHSSYGAIAQMRYAGGTWNTTAIIPDQSGSGGEGLAAADLDGNGLLDIISGFGVNLYAAHQNSPGNFAAPVLVGSGVEAWYALPGTIRSVRTADLDLDGRPDCVGVFDKGILIFHNPPAGSGARRNAVLLARNSTLPQSDVALLRFDDDAVPDVVYRDPVSTRMMVDLIQTPSLSLSVLPASPYAVNNRYPVQGTTQVPLLKLTATSWGWPGDAGVALEKIAIRFRHDDAASTPYNAPLLAQTFSSFALYEDIHLEGTLETGTFDPLLANLAAATPDAAGRSLLTLSQGVIVAAGGSRQLFLSGFFNTPGFGQTLRLDLAWAIQGPSTQASTTLPGTDPEPVEVMSNADFARFISSAPTPRQSWRAFHFNIQSDIGIAANAADPDGDGLSNILEYALGLNPKIPDPAPISQMQTGFSSVFFSFVAREIQPDTNLSVFSSPDLASWQPRAARGADGYWTTDKAVLTPEGGSGGLRQQVFSVQRTPGGQEFFRLEAYELNP